MNDEWHECHRWSDNMVRSLDGRAFAMLHYKPQSTEKKSFHLVKLGDGCVYQLAETTMELLMANAELNDIMDITYFVVHNMGTQIPACIWDRLHHEIFGDQL